MQHPGLLLDSELEEDPPELDPEPDKEDDPEPDSPELPDPDSEPLEPEPNPPDDKPDDPDGPLPELVEEGILRVVILGQVLCFGLLH